MAQRSKWLGRIAQCAGAIFAALAIVAATACSSPPATCVDVPLSRKAQAALEVVAAQIDFTPILPCAYGPGFVVRSVIVGTLPGSPPQQRISFVVERGDEPFYVLSETRAPVTFSQIPQGTHWLRVSAGVVVAEGFAGPSGNDGDLAYLRWRIDGVTYELGATLGRARNEEEVRQLAMALIPRSGAATTRPRRAGRKRLLRAR